jgi:hypothetical protein
MQPKHDAHRVDQFGLGEPRTPTSRPWPPASTGRQRPLQHDFLAKDDIGERGAGLRELCGGGFGSSTIRSALMEEGRLRSCGGIRN